MGFPPVGSKYPPDIFNEFDDDEDRSLKRVFHKVFDLAEPMDLATAAKEIDAYYPLYDAAQYEAWERSLETDGETGLEGMRNAGMVTRYILVDFFGPLAKQIPFDHAYGQNRLVDLLLALGALPPKPAWSRPDGGKKVWAADRAGLEYSMHYEFDGELFGAKYEDPSNVAAQQETRNFNSWAALMHARRLGDFSLYALWVIRKGLEVSETTHGTVLDYRVPRAADWIIRAGSELPVSDKDYGRPGMGDELWRGSHRSRGFALERWQFWNARLLLIAKMDILSQATRDIATMAAAKTDDRIGA